jgi:hypothetical protein
MAKLFFILLTFLFAQTSLADVTPYIDKNLNSLLVHGQGVTFSVNVPAGWKGDTENATQYSSSIIFYPASQSLDSGPTIIRVLVVDKTGENFNEVLDQDMKDFRTQYPDIVFRNLSLSHPEYQVSSKLFTIPGKFYEYVAYVNPGPGKKLMFSVSMDKQNKEASRLELDVYQSILSSLQML